MFSTISLMTGFIMRAMHVVCCPFAETDIKPLLHVRFRQEALSVENPIFSQRLSNITKSRV